jgi:hypothetical protein
MTGAGDADPAAALIVSGGGTTLVATDVLLAEAARLRLLQAAAEGWQDRLARIRSLDSEPVPAPAWTGTEAGLNVFGAACSIDTVAERSRTLADSLTAAAEGYGRAERAIEWGARLSGVWIGFTLGRLAPFLVAAAVPGLTAGVLGFLLGNLLTRARPGDAAAGLGDWFQAHPRALTNPIVVAAVRSLVSSVDDVAAGGAGVPFPLSFALGDEGAGLLGVTSSAAGVLALARPLGLLGETPVSVTRLAEAGSGRNLGSRSTPPVGFEDLAARIPSVSDDGPQLRIERYGGPDDAAWVVYIGGTAAWSPVTGEQPWDLTSNIAAVADQGAGSYRAVVQSMREAGVQPRDPVVQVGHSQGGLVAAQLAASGEFNTVAVATFGAPNGQITLPADVAAVTVEHSDDLVPALGGMAGAEDERLVVRREVFAGGEVPPGEALPAHALAAYRETGRLMDASAEPRLREFRAALEAVIGVEPGRATRWRGSRVPGR